MNPIDWLRSLFPGEQTCAACAEHFATNIHPWWFDFGLAACLLIVVAELALINWQRWTRR